jgi:hypothetical protein
MRKNKTEILLVLFAAILLCSVGFLNNFPLIYSDTADYLGGAFGRYIPVDRPVFYGLFIRIVSLQASLWLVIAVQGILMSYLLFETLGIFYSGNKRNLFFIASVTILTLCTGISHNVSILLPDIFSPIGILCFINLLLNNKLNKVQRILLSLILLLCILLHYSNLLVLLTLCIILVLYILIKMLRKKQNIILQPKRLMACFVILLSFFIIAPTANYIFGKKFIISESSHVFLLNHLLETGILEDYLNNECAHKNYKLCAYKDHLDTNFIWDGNSVFGKVGGWDGTKEEFNSIIFDVLTTPKYAKKVLVRFTEYSFMQYFSFEISNSHKYGVPPYLQNWPYKLYGRDYCASLQYNSRLDFSFTNSIQRILVLASLGFLIVIVFIPFYFNMLNAELKWLTVLILFYSFLNAAICANFSTLNYRFQNRIIWLIPFVAFIIAEHLISAYLSRKKTITNS